MLKIIKNPDAAIYEEMTEAVKANDGYCPCAIVKDEDTRCPCRDFREQTTEGECHCGRFVKTKEEKENTEK
jgi:ferredoxin-thioredoxin reductase catalytic subunit